MSKVLINVNELNEIEKLKEIGITNFLFAVDEFSIGYNSFPLKDIPIDSYLYINRVLDTSDVDKLKQMKKEFIKYKGIIFEDIAIYNIFKDTNLELIWNQVHFATNTSSINFWLDRVDSCVISNELTKEEIESIIQNVKKPIVLNILGKNNVMYSRRKLLSNFNEYNNLDAYSEVILKEPITNEKFLAIETEAGTYLLSNEYFNYVNKINVLDSNIKFYLILNKDLKVKQIAEILNGKTFGTDGFLNKKTVYKLKDFKGGN